MKWVKNEMPMKVGEIVSRRTGMPRADLLNDVKEYNINNMSDAVNLFIKHVKAKGKIGSFCDYDTDGINCANGMKTLGKVISYPIDVYVPKRFSDGYGIKSRHIKHYVEEGYNLLILCDNGIAANEAVSEAKANGIDVIILDHHENRVDEAGNVMLPDADVIVDPHVTGADFEDYCGAGLVYCFSKQVLARCNYVVPAKKRAALKKICTFAAIGTIGDVVSLTGENRRIVKDGLKNIMENGATTGMNALMKKMYLSDYITSVDVGFTVSPSFNAAGRLEDAGSSFVSDVTSYDGLSADSMNNKIEKIIELNKKRKKISKERFSAMDAYIAEHELDKSNFIVLVDNEGTIGINGLTAGKITEKYNVPSIVFSPISDDLLKGSGRAPEWANLKAILDKNNLLIEAYGGHPEACGITLNKKNIDAFRKAVQKTTPQPPHTEQSTTLSYDIECGVKDVPLVTDAVNIFGPYGQDNPEIVVRVDNIPLQIGVNGSYEFFMGENKQHLKLSCRYFDILWFDGSEQYKAMGSPREISVVGTVGLNVYKGKAKIQVMAIDVKPAK